ncbi:MAG: hypothetical protein V4760_14220, partial [Bdellovibrionota bacterium]
MPLGTKLRDRFSLSRILKLRDPRRDLSSILEAANPSAPLAERIAWMTHLIEWLRKKTLVEENADQRMVRVRFLVQLLDRQPEWKAKAGAVIVSILRDSEAPLLFAQTELSEHHAFLNEMIRRLSDRFIPSPPRVGELSYALDTIFHDSGDHEWLEAMTEMDWAAVAEIMQNGTALLGQGPDPDKLAWRRDLEDAVVTISVQAAAIGLDSEVRMRLRAANPGQSPVKSFTELNRHAVKWRESRSKSEAAFMKGAAAACEAAVSHAFAVIENSGVSLTLVYKLEALTAYLRRLELLVGIIDASDSGETPLFTARDLFLELVRTNIDRRSARSLLQMNFDLFARKLVEHAGETGEHYITRTAKEYFAMFKAAGGGGLVTVVTVLAKFAISSVKWPLFLEGILLWGNYSISFLAMQAFGFALATKQPSMTAAALAGKLSETLDRNRLGEFVDEVARISRSQFIAAVGNIGFVIPGALLCDFVFRMMTGHHVLTSEYAEKTLVNLHPWKSLSVYYAAITGVLLWLSSFGAGWLQNWVVFRRLPEAIAAHPRLRAVLGDHRAKGCGQWLANNAAGIGGNVSIGFLLAFTPVMGHFFGLPLDARHVTLSTGQATFAFSALDPALITWQQLAATSFGIVLIGLMNFGVSTA